MEEARLELPVDVERPLGAGGTGAAGAHDLGDGPTGRHDGDAVSSRLSRRRLLALGGLGAVGAGAGAAGVGVAIARRSDDGRRSNAGQRDGSTDAGAPSAAVAVASSVVPFHGEHQAGIVTPAQDRLHFAAFDLTTTDRDAVRDLLRRWSAAAEQLVAGVPIGSSGAVLGPAAAPPEDTGEALDLAPSRLTITIGFGRSLFLTDDGRDRFGLAAAMPKQLIELPKFPGDRLDPLRSGGDLCVQACADDPQVAVHAVRNLARLGFGVASVRWSQLGFGRTSSTSSSQLTPRNLFGFKDGTANLKAEDRSDIDRHVWVASGDGPDWMTGGSYLVARRISMHIETWDRTSLAEQEAVIGRQKSTGAPLSGGSEHTAPDFALLGKGGQPLVAADSHVRLAHPSQNGGQAMLRRGYNFTDGSDGLGRLDAGLFFLAFVRDPVQQYVPIQTRLSRDDALSEYLVHTGSGLFAVPPGAGPGGFVGEGLFA